MLYKKFIVLFVVGLHCRALQSMNPSDWPDFTPSDNGIARLTDEFVGLTTAESDDSTDSDQLEHSAAHIESSESDSSGSMNLPSAHLDYSDDFIHSRLDSASEQEVQSPALSRYRKSVDESLKYHQKASVPLQSPSGLKSDDFQSAMHGISTNTSGGGNRIDYASRNRSGASAGSSFGCYADKKENNNSWNTDDVRGTKKRSIEAKKHANNQIARKEIACIMKDLAKNDGVMNSAQKKNFTENYAAMGYTPGNSKVEVGRDLLNFVDNLSSDTAHNSSSKNKRKRELLKSNPKIEECIGAVSKCISSPEVRSFAVVNTEHVTDGDCTYDEGVISAVSGLHSLTNCRKQKLLDKDQYVFIGQDNKTIGVLLGNKVSKSMKHDITEDDVIAAVLEGKTVARLQDIRNFKMSQIPDGTFVGSYHVVNNPSVYSTIYPLLVVDATDGFLNQKNIYVGKFTKLDENGNPIEKSSRGKEVYLTPGQFQAMMNGGKKFTVSQGYEGFHFSDITTQMQEHCRKMLKQAGMSQFPSEIIGMLNDNKFNNSKK